MKYPLLLMLSLLMAMGHTRTGGHPIPTAALPDSARPDQRYPDEVLLRLLDSAAALPQAPLMQRAAALPDSLFYARSNFTARTISPADFSLLKKAAKTKELDTAAARRIFRDYGTNGFSPDEPVLPLSFYSFDDGRPGAFKYFAVCPGGENGAWENDLYFFHGNRLVAMHHITHHYGLELKHFKDADGRMVIYYRENYDSGSGIWWFNNYFYKYRGDELVPVLDELQNGNQQQMWGYRVYWLEAKVVKTVPLTMKMVYYQELPDTAGYTRRIIDDSTTVRYRWDESAFCYRGDYAHSKLSKAQILTYCLGDNEPLFMNAYQPLLRRQLRHPRARAVLLQYLNTLKNSWAGQ